MAEIQKFTLAYVAPEDRIAWDTEDDQGATTRLWLTQRFCRQFVEAVIARLPAPASSGSPEHAEAAQSFEQAAAMSSFGKTSRVRVDAGAAAGLVSQVQIRPRVGGLILAFEFGDGERRDIAMTSAATRQMLGVMHGLYLAAGWPAEFWPAWIATPPTRDADSASLH